MLSARNFLKVIAVCIGGGVLVIPFLSREPQAIPEKTPSALEERLLSGSAIPLTDDIFRSFSKICVVGWNNSGWVPSDVKGVCGDPEENSIIGVNKATNTCTTLWRRSDSAIGMFNVHGEGTSICEDVGSGRRLGIRSMPEGFYDEIDLLPKES